MKNINKFLTIAANAILIIIAMVGIVIIWSILPLKNNFKILSVTSSSMSPAIPLGSVIVVKPESEYVVGDIITFHPVLKLRQDENITHRITKVLNEDNQVSYVTKGDANNMPDITPVTADRIVGKEIVSVAALGFLLGYIKTLPGLILVVIAPAIILIYGEVRKIRSEVEKSRQESKKVKKNKKVSKVYKKKATGSKKQKKGNKNVKK